jgi:hypothetical protein
MFHEANVEDLMSNLIILRSKYQNNHISFDEYSKYYDKIYHWIENYHLQE